MLSPLEEIKNRLELVAYLKPFVQNLQPSGKSLRGLCPFHKEKTPSFFISPDKQVWYCFGCQKGGDLMKFVMERERMEFSEALRFLAEKAGVKLEKQDPKLETLKNRVLDVLKLSSKFYRFHLGKNQEVQSYLKNRGLRSETVNFFELGFSPGPPAGGWQNLYAFLKKQGFEDESIEQSGMVIRAQTNGSREPRFYDRFRGRVMFPIFDHNRRVVGFSGRIAPLLHPVESQFAQEQSQEAKYINTPETIVYQKGKILFGFSHTQNEIREKEQAVLVEGNLDVLMGWQEGLKNIVAVSGTGLTESQLRSLSRSCKKLVLSFDMDRAGEQATDRSIGLASQMGFELSILSLPADKDLADYARDFPEKVIGLLGQSKSVMEYYFANILSSLDLNLLEGKKKFLAYLLPRIKFLRSPVEQSEWLVKLASQIKVPEKMIFDEFEKTKSLLEINPDFDETWDEVGSGLFIKTRQERLAEKIIGLAVRFPEFSSRLKGFHDCFPFRFREIVTRLHQALAAGSGQAQAETAEIEFGDWSYFYLLGDYELSFLPDNFSPEQELEKSLLELKKTALRAKSFEYNLAIKEAEQAGNFERSRVLLKEMSLVLSELKSLEPDSDA